VTPRGRRALAAWVIAVCFAGAASAAHTHRPRFEPTDLELEDTGTAEFDFQVGPAFGSPNGNRLVVPDFDLDVGILPNVEVDLDATFSIDDFDGPHPHLAGAALWTAVKLGLFDSRGENGRSIAGGLEIGPRLPTIGMRGIGYAGLALLGLNFRNVHLSGNLGAIVDPGPQITRGQAKSVVGGLALDLDLDEKNEWSLLSYLAGAYYLSADPNEVTVACGAAYNVVPSLELSAIVLGGLVPGADRGAILFGVSPKVALW
jgi:hypothetical protein